MLHSVVIGGVGFVGSWLVEELLKDPSSRVTIIDNLISSERWNLSKDPRVNFIEGSAADYRTFEKIGAQIDVLYQLACFHGNQSSIALPLEDFENGLRTTLVSLEWIKNNSPKTRVIYAGAGCAVADKTWTSPKPVTELESTSLLHDSPYSISKITGEMYCLFYANHFNLDVVRVRFQNIYGPKEILGAGKWRGTKYTIWRNVVPTFIWKCLHNENIEIYGRGSRDFIFVEDVVRGITLATKHGLKGNVYNIASGIETSIEELALQILNLTGSKSQLQFHKPRSWDNSGRRVGDISNSSLLLGFKSSVSLVDGLNRTLSWTRDNLDRIQQSIKAHEKNISDF